MKLPPLRQQKQDLPELVGTSLPRIARRLRVTRTPPLSAEAIAALQNYDFPGNVRERENMLERALILPREAHSLSSEDLGLPTPASADRQAAEGLMAATATAARPQGSNHAALNVPEGFLLEDWERYAIARALGQCGGNRTRAAQLLGIGRRTLQEKIVRCELS